MYRTKHRVVPAVAAGLAALALGAAPALAGSDGCGGADCQDEDSPATVVPVAPQPVTPALLPTRGGGEEAGSPSSPQRPTVTRTRHVVRRTRGESTRTVAVRTVPRGAVAAGAGGTAPHGPDGVLAGIAGAGLVLLAAGGGLVLTGRRS